MTKPSIDLPIIKLFGDPTENFYQLGLKDKNRHILVLDHINSLIKTPWKGINLVAGEVLKQVLARTLANCPHFKKNISAYSEGLGTPFDEVARALLTPELLSFMSKWIPGLPPGLLGCSSYFFWDDKLASPAHGRILDFPLLGSFDKEERVIITKFNNSPKIFSYGSVGMPYPGLTAMNSEGVSYALHQKFTNTLNQNGTPIFELAFQLMSKVGDKESAIEFLKKNQSITPWGINLGFSDGSVLTAELSGTDLFYREHQLEPGKVIYVNNKLENSSLEQKDFFPYGLDEFNHLREEVALEKIDKFLNKKEVDDKKVLKVISSPLINKSSPLRPDPTTMSSLGISIFNPSKGRALIISKEGPKYFKGEAYKITDLWKEESISIELYQDKKTEPKYCQGMRHLMLAQVAFDKDVKEDIYHHLQMSIEFLSEYKERYLASFFFLIFQYKEEKHEKVRSNLLDQFKDLRGNLTPYLEDNISLFIYRLERLTKVGSTISAESFKNEKIKTLYLEEEKIPDFLLHKATATLLNPRIDMWDCIHAHIKA
ncbi:MAG: hypothetical protein ACJAT2_001740 [Bacteriovoracaceae bacterium]|jgi:hypothetical protein